MELPPSSSPLPLPTHHHYLALIAFDFKPPSSQSIIFLYQPPLFCILSIYLSVVFRFFFFMIPYQEAIIETECSMNDIDIERQPTAEHKNTHIPTEQKKSTQHGMTKPIQNNVHHVLDNCCYCSLIVGFLQLYFHYIYIFLLNLLSNTTFVCDNIPTDDY